MMNRTAKIVLEYLSPNLAAELMTRLHASLPQDPSERNAHLSEMHRDLKKVFDERVVPG